MFKSQTNPILIGDSYKNSHGEQNPEGLEYVSSYIESRGAINPNTKEMVVMGIHHAIKEVLSTPITTAHIDEAEDVLTKHGFTFDRSRWEYIRDTYDGWIPLMLEAFPEGSVVPLSTPIAQIVNTDKNLPWLTSYFEPPILRAIWYPSTVATKSREIKKILKRGMLTTAGHTEGLDFMLHDFGCRGVSSHESAAIGGLAHLVNFKGTDTIPALMLAREYYDEDMAGFSVPASEHSTITAWGRENEFKAFENMLDKFGKDGATFSCVTDSYNIYDGCTKGWGGVLKDRVVEFGSRGGRLVVRPDSGPLLETIRDHEYIVGHKSVPIECVELLMDSFGYTTNDLGYRVLPTYIRVLQGDGWKSETDFEEFLEILKFAKISMENFVFGMGGGLLQSVTRDDLKFAMKASAVKDANGWRSVFKDPYHGGKTSKRGRFNAVGLDGRYSVEGGEDVLTANFDGEYVMRGGEDETVVNAFEVMYQNGRTISPSPFEYIRKRAEV